jgi:hypothetical protein
VRGLKFAFLFSGKCEAGADGSEPLSKDCFRRAADLS